MLYLSLGFRCAEGVARDILANRVQRTHGATKEYRVNRQIRAPEVRVIRGDESGESLVLPFLQALELAEEEGLDLVEVAPTQSPPVCRLLDYGRFKFVQSKKAKEARKGRPRTTLKEVRMKPRIGEHDIEAKTRRVRTFLGDGAKVKVSVLFRGREITHPELAVRLLRRVAEAVASEAKLERAPQMEARSLSIILAPATSSGAGSEKRDGDAEDQDA